MVMPRRHLHERVRGRRKPGDILLRARLAVRLRLRQGDRQCRRNRQDCARCQVSAGAGAGQATAGARGAVVAAPISGTFYRSPAPGEPPFVAEGQPVQAGDVLCLIESMKMMNRVEADTSGTVVAVLLDDGRAIEAGTPLFHIA